MNVRTASRPWSRRSRARRAAVAAAVVALGLAGLSACDSASGSDGPKLAADAALPDKVPDGTVLRVGDPATQTAIEASGLDQELEDEGVEIEWANISGGPKTLDAFRADAIDVGSAQDIPPLFAQWTGTDITIVATTSRVDAHQPPGLRAGCRPGRRRDVPGGPQGQEDRLLPRPGAGRAGAAGARQGRAEPGRRRARRDPERRRRLRQRARQQGGRRRAAGRHPADVVPREVRQRRRHLDPHRDPRRPEPALRAGGDHGGRRQGGRAGQVRRGVGQGQAVDQRAPRGVRPGVLRRPRGARPSRTASR